MGKGRKKMAKTTQRGSCETCTYYTYDEEYGWGWIYASDFWPALPVPVLSKWGWLPHCKTSDVIYQLHI